MHTSPKTEIVMKLGSGKKITEKFPLDFEEPSFLGD